MSTMSFYFVCIFDDYFVSFFHLTRKNLHIKKKGTLIRKSNRIVMCEENHMAIEC